MNEQVLEPREPPFDAMDAAVSRTPREGSHGYYVLDMYSGLGAFVWFDGEEETLRYLVEDEPGMLEETEYAPEPDLRRCFEVAAEGIEKENVADADVPAYVNARIPNDRFRMVWYGGFDALRAGEGDFAQDLRAAYGGENRECLENGEDALDFASFLRDYRL